jgi:hypothetical protein
LDPVVVPDEGEVGLDEDGDVSDDEKVRVLNID